MALAQGGDPQAEGQDLLARVGPALDEATALAHRVGGDFLDEPRLADARLAEHCHHPGPAFAGETQRRAHLSQLGGSPDQGEPRGGVSAAWRRGLGGARRTRRRGRLRGSLGEDLLVEPLGLGLGLDAQLAPQGLDADLISAERRRAASLGGIEAHQRPVDGLLERIEGEQAQGRLDGPLRQGGRGLPGEQRAQDAQAQLVQALALAREPALEGRVFHHETGQELPPVERCGPFERGERVLRRRSLELEHVHGEIARVQRHALVIGDEAPLTPRPEDAPQLEESLAQAIARLLVRAVSPEKPGQPSPRLRVAR